MTFGLCVCNCGNDAIIYVFCLKGAAFTLFCLQPLKSTDQAEISFRQLRESSIHSHLYFFSDHSYFLPIKYWLGFKKCVFFFFLAATDFANRFYFLKQFKFIETFLFIEQKVQSSYILLLPPKTQFPTVTGLEYS